MSWACIHCETLNDDAHDHCEVCNAERVSLTRWVCPNCETENQEHESHCEVCGFDKTKAAELKFIEPDADLLAGLFGTIEEPGWRVPGNLKIRKKELVKEKSGDSYTRKPEGAYEKFMRLSPETKKKRLFGWSVMVAVGLLIWAPWAALQWFLYAAGGTWITYILKFPWKKPIDKWLASGYKPEAGFKEVIKETEKYEEGHKNPIACLVFNAEGDQLISVDERGILNRWLAETGEKRKSGTIVKERFDNVLIGPNAAYMLDFDKIKVIRPDGSLRTTLNLNWSGKTLSSGRRKRIMKLDSTGNKIALGSESGEIILADTTSFTTKKVKTTKDAAITSIAFLPGGYQMIAGTQNGNLMLINNNLTQVEREINFPGKSILSLATQKRNSASSLFAISFSDGTVEIRDSFQDSKPRIFSLNPEELGRDSLFSALLMEYLPGQEMLVTVNQLGIIQVWDTLADKPVLLKRGISGTLEELLQSAEYIFSSGNEKIILCERGIRTFEKAYRNTLDINAIPVLKEKSHLPVVIDPSHGIGLRSFVEPIALAGIIAGADGVLVEIHPTPEEAFSDGAQTLNFKEAEQLFTKARALTEFRAQHS